MYKSRAENGPVKKTISDCFLYQKENALHLSHKDTAIQIMCTLIMTRHGKLL